jgi:UDP-N-acetylglucosamine--N-acetylmuramyl-(pentapeptide) pyrophosphoryl-undecaprenol N-acetylglucosamine transferase
MNSSMPILIMAGGTGGHVFPALAVAEQLRARRVPIVWLGTRRGLEAKLVPAAGIPMEWLSVAGLRGTGRKRLVLAPFMIAKAVWQAMWILRRIRPRLVLGMGGFVSGPGGLVSRCFGIPLIVHEQNALPGMTNRWLARIASRVLEAFPGSFPAARRATTVGNPVRADIVALADPDNRLATRSGRPRLLVIGGSQGALVLNRLVPKALGLMKPADRPEVWHQAGGRMADTTADSYRDAGVTARLEPFINDMAAAYGWADLVVCRAGALTVSELAAAGVGAILVPFPHAVDDHQTANAGFLARAGAAIIVQQVNLTASVLADLLRELLADRDRLLVMARAGRRLARADAAQRVASLCVEQEALG